MARKRATSDQSSYSSIGLLIFRVWVGVSLFAKHGLEKVLHFSTMRHHFPDPIHVGPTVGLIFALISDALCAVLIALGIYTRIAALFEVINLAVIFIFMHNASFAQEHAETVYLYLGAYIVILFCGPGKYSIDAAMGRRR